jgi:hypothetical protein
VFTSLGIKALAFTFINASPVILIETSAELNGGFFFSLRKLNCLNVVSFEFLEEKEV